MAQLRTKMIETALTAIATGVTAVILPKAVEAVGEKLGETAFDKGGEGILAIRKAIRDKLTAVGTHVLLKRAEEKPSEGNRQVLQAELVSQMEEDETFANRLQELVELIKPDFPELQSILDDALIRGELEIDGIEIQNEGKPHGKQTIGKNLKVGQNAKFGKILIENKGE